MYSLSFSFTHNTQANHFFSPSTAEAQLLCDAETQLLCTICDQLTILRPTPP